MSQPLPGPGIRDESSGGCWEVLRIAFPLIMVNAGQSVKIFCDRLMLSWYSQIDVAASMTAGMTSFLCLTIFFGICGYAGTFVAQYTGAGRNDRVGLVVWQALWMAVGAGALLATGPLWAEPLFRLIGHSPEVQAAEVKYFRILLLGAIGPLLVNALAPFWVGRGKTWTIVAMQCLSMLANLFGNWWLIFGTKGCYELSHRAVGWRETADSLGAAGFLHRFLAYAGEGLENILNASARALSIPELGIDGAAMATVGTDFIAFIFLAVLFLMPKNRRIYGTWPKRLFDGQLLKRMIRFGFPNGAQFFVDIFAFNAFNILMGLYSAEVLFAATVAFSMNSIAVMPMIGLANASGILVGQSIGAGDIGHAKRSVRSGRWLIFAYIFVIAAVFVFIPEPISGMFANRNADPVKQAELLALANSYLRFVAAYLVFDGMFFLYANAIRGAGDTKFAMNAMLVLAIFGLLTPCIVAFKLEASPEVLWYIMVGYVMVSGLTFYARYRTGKWERMRVIEEAPPLPGDPAVTAASASGRFTPVP